MFDNRRMARSERPQALASKRLRFLKNGGVEKRETGWRSLSGSRAGADVLRSNTTRIFRKPRCCRSERTNNSHSRDSDTCFSCTCNHVCRRLRRCMDRHHSRYRRCSRHTMIQPFRNTSLDCRNKHIHPYRCCRNTPQGLPFRRRQSRLKLPDTQHFAPHRPPWPSSIRRRSHQTFRCCAWRTHSNTSCCRCRRT